MEIQGIAIRKKSSYNRIQTGINSRESAYNRSIKNSTKGERLQVAKVTGKKQKKLKKLSINFQKLDILSSKKGEKPNNNKTKRW